MSMDDDDNQRVVSSIIALPPKVYPTSKTTDNSLPNKINNRVKHGGNSSSSLFNDDDGSIHRLVYSIIYNNKTFQLIQLLFLLLQFFEKKLFATSVATFHNSNWFG